MKPAGLDQQRMPATAWHALAPTDVAATLATDANSGVTDSEAARRLVEHGPNELREKGLKSPARILWEQISATMVVVLIVAAIVSALIGDLRDAAAILAIVIINAILGFVQEYRAEKAIAALKKLASPTVRVRRGGRASEVPARQVVPGDVVLLEAGALVPADGRLVESASLRIEEAALTGESEPVDKDVETLLDADLPLADRRNMAYLGTLVTYGRGAMVVTSTGQGTELGRISDLIQGVEAERTPLQHRLDRLGRTLAVVVLAIVAVLVVIGLLRGEELRLMLLTAIGLAVAAIPEALPAVVTIALALGAQRMLRRRALIRSLPAVEALGSVTTICSDKTGTLTENRMTVVVLDAAGERVDLETVLQRSHPALVRGDGGPPLIVCDSPTLGMLVACGALCTDATLRSEPESPGLVRAIGDPTEGALVIAAAQLGLDKATLEADLPRIAELPFDSDRKMMSTVHSIDGTTLVPCLEPALGLGEGQPAAFVTITKGAPDSVVAVCDRIWTGDEIVPLDAGWHDRVHRANEYLAAQGIRVLGLALRPLAEPPASLSAESVEADLIFVGFFGLIDPPRSEVIAAVRECRSAGIRPIMITGDHPLTALQIARTLGITEDGAAVTGREIDALSDADLVELVGSATVYARVSPEHKLRIVRALQARGEIAAMTGDGVNDAPALRQANVGVAMGITGTDVSKEAADVILLDDNFSTIVAAVEEGRVIFDNVRKYIRHTLAGNVGAIIVMFVSTLIGMPVALLPLQILWMNLVTDGLPSTALGVEPPERDVMKRQPVRPDESVFSPRITRGIVWGGILIGALAMGAGYLYWSAGIESWQTFILTALIFERTAHIFAIRSNRDSLFRIGLLSNRFLLGAVVLSIALQFAIIYVAPLQEVFSTVPLSASEVLVAIALSVVVFAAVELAKLRQRRVEAE